VLSRTNRSVLIMHGGITHRPGGTPNNHVPASNTAAALALFDNQVSQPA
jgi:hypothetical protein